MAIKAHVRPSIAARPSDTASEESFTLVSRRSAPQLPIPGLRSSSSLERSTHGRRSRWAWEVPPVPNHPAKSLARVYRAAESNARILWIDHRRAGIVRRTRAVDSRLSAEGYRYRVVTNSAGDGYACRGAVAGIEFEQCEQGLLDHQLVFSPFDLIRLHRVRRWSQQSAQQWVVMARRLYCGSRCIAECRTKGTLEVDKSDGRCVEPITARRRSRLL